MLTVDKLVAKNATFTRLEAIAFPEAMGFPDPFYKKMSGYLCALQHIPTLNLLDSTH